MIKKALWCAKIMVYGLAVETFVFKKEPPFDI